MSADRFLDRNSVIDQFVSKIFDLRNSAFQIFKFRCFVQTNRQSCHISSCHSAVSDKSFVDNGKIGSVAVHFFIVQSDKSTDVHQTVFLGTHGHPDSVRENFFTDFFDASVFLSGFSFLNEISVFRKTGSVKNQRNAVLVGEFFHRFDVFQRNGLSTGSVARNRNQTKRNLFFWMRFVNLL